ncbi:MAG: CTP synthase [Candidatus Magasanikbacteria bacterium]|jgi:CTP synthase|nr:CTP synthase [Candidatus Magasanikbacteria bacterium]MBT4071598.1 CTP synthase [Candidatus Magasanikbacteria bacterium]
MEIKKKQPKFIFVVGGVMSSVGKGVTAASISAILKSSGHNVTNVKCDMYINIDAGTIRPTEHGEVFVGEDGIEADQDLGNYERFSGNKMSSVNYITTGQVYLEIITKERNLEYGGEDVEVVPDVPNEIIRRIKLAQQEHDAEVTVVEFGGTIGEYQVLLFLEAARMMKLKDPDDVAFVLVSYLPIPSHIGEMKTKPTQHAARTLNSAGINADFIIARGVQELDKPRREKLATFCGVKKDHCISAPDVSSIYKVPFNFEKEELGKKLLRTLHMEEKDSDLSKWNELVEKIDHPKKEVKIAVVGKYFGTGNYTLSDSYISVIEAIKHAAWYNDAKPVLEWVDSEAFEKDPKKVEELAQFDGVIVPGGFGTRGVEGIINAIQYVRENNIPYLGICYGMQLASVEFVRNVLGKKEAHTVEVDKDVKEAVIHINPNQADNVKEHKYGGTMRLGAYDCELTAGSKARKAYGKDIISERHRHRYEFNNDYREMIDKAGLKIVGVNKKSDLVEVVELENHPFFIGVQYHPEFRSRPIEAHPLFREFVCASLARKKS